MKFVLALFIMAARGSMQRYRRQTPAMMGSGGSTPYKMLPSICAACVFRGLQMVGASPRRMSGIAEMEKTRMEDLTQLSDADLDEKLRAIKAEKQKREATVVIGAAGAVGTRLCAALAARGHRVIATDRMTTLPNSLQRSIADRGTCIGGVDVCNMKALQALFYEHADANTTVWNLAAPLSVETAQDPAVAEAVTVGGMANVLHAMAQVGARRICFTDSIGSFGADAPRRGATARWLIENPAQVLNT